jgi:hypothetical protein
VKHRANPKFWRYYAALPENIQRLADENYKALKRDPYHPSLRLLSFMRSAGYLYVRLFFGICYSIYMKVNEILIMLKKDGWYLATVRVSH